MPNLDSEQQLVLERVYRDRHRSGQWPHLQQLQRELTSEQLDVGVRSVVMRTADHIGVVSPDEQLRLTLKGLDAISESRPLLEAYLKALRTILQRYADTSQEPKFTHDDPSRTRAPQR
jgi:hypothetical protein